MEALPILEDCRLRLVAGPASPFALNWRAGWAEAFPPLFQAGVENSGVSLEKHEEGGSPEAPHSPSSAVQAIWHPLIRKLSLRISHKAGGAKMSSVQTEQILRGSNCVSLPSSEELLEVVALRLPLFWARQIATC